MFNATSYPVNGFNNLLIQDDLISLSLSDNGKVCVQGTDESNPLGYETLNAEGKTVWEPWILDTDKVREIIKYGDPDQPQFMLPVHSGESKRQGYIKTANLDIVWDLVETFALGINSSAAPSSALLATETQPFVVFADQNP